MEATTAVKPKIFAFSNIVGGGDGEALAMAADGTVLGGHWCSHEGFVSHDLGVTPGSRPDRHADYAKHYPDGYEMEFVRAADIDAAAIPARRDSATERDLIGCQKRISRTGHACACRVASARLRPLIRRRLRRDGPQQNRPL